MFHHDNSDEEDNNILSGTISINDSIVVQPTVHRKIFIFSEERLNS